CRPIAATGRALPPLAVSVPDGAAVATGVRNPAGAGVATAAPPASDRSPPPSLRGADRAVSASVSDRSVPDIGRVTRQSPSDTNSSTTRPATTTGRRSRNIVGAPERHAGPAGQRSDRRACGEGRSVENGDELRRAHGALHLRVRRARRAAAHPDAAGHLP